MTRERLLRAAVVVAGLAALWAIVVMWTGGGVLSLSGLRISSRGIRNPGALLFVSALAAWLMAPAGQRRHALTKECEWLLGVITQGLHRLPSIREKGLQQLSLMDGTTDQYLLRIVSAKNVDVLRIARELYDSGLFQWAEPDFIQEYKRQG